MSYFVGNKKTMATAKDVQRRIWAEDILKEYSSLQETEKRFTKNYDHLINQRLKVMSQTMATYAASNKVLVKRTLQILKAQLPQYSANTVYNNPKFDIELQYLDEIKYVEVQRDFRSQQTGNIFMEVGQCGEPSCLAITKADVYFIWTSDTEYYVVPTETLKTLCLDSQQVSNGGEMGGSEGFLISLDRLQKYKQGFQRQPSQEAKDIIAECEKFRQERNKGEQK